MHAYVEQSARTRSDCPVQCLSWMGKIPDGIPDEDGWSLSRASCYQEGWLATGNGGGIVGVTYTAGHLRKIAEGPARSNFNLRGHRSEIILVKWNEPYQKLATCDSTGVIFVWIKHEGRWSIELINDRSSQVTDFTWSHDGRMALICYRDGFVLVGSVAGQRFWSSMLNLDNCLVTSGAWSHDDQKVLFGTTDGQIIVMTSGGVMLTQTTIQDTVDISAMAWACEKFSLSDQDKTSTAANDTAAPILAVTFRTGAVYLMSSYDDLCPKVIHTGLTGLKMEWSSDGSMLAVAGFIRLPNLECHNEIRFYNRAGVLRYRLNLQNQSKPVSHLTWGHNDYRLFVAVGCHVYTVWVTKSIASLQLLCRRCIHRNVHDDQSIHSLPLPAKILANIQSMFCPTIRGYIPEAHLLREFVCIPPAAPERLHCTMIRHGEECSGGHYTLYLEYMGGLIPLLKGKRASKIRPEFIIFDPKIKAPHATNKDEDCVFVSSDSSLSATDSDEDMMVDGCGSPRVQRRKKSRKLKDRFERRDSVGMASLRPMDELMYDDNLPEGQKLAEVTANLWGTKFKLHSLASFLPEDLGQVLYKTSLLHLQPRQMTVTIVEINPELKPQARDPSYNANHFSESEDEVIQVDGSQSNEVSVRGAAWSGYHDNAVAISPEAPACPHPIQTTGSISPIADGMPPLDRHPRLPGAKSPVFVDRKDQLAPLEIRSLEASPPQRRSPSLKPCTLSPADQHPLAANNTLVNGDILTTGQIAVEVLKNKGLVSPTKDAVLKSTDRADLAVKATVQTLSCVGALPTVVHSGPVLSNRLVQTPGREEQYVPRPTDFQPRAVPVVTATRQTASTQSESNVPTDTTGLSSTNSKWNEPSSQCPATRPQPELAIPCGGQTRWAGKACHDLKYIDDDPDETRERSDRRDAVFCNTVELSAREVMSSMQMLHHLDQISVDSMTGSGDLGPARLRHVSADDSIDFKSIRLSDNKSQSKPEESDIGVRTNALQVSTERSRCKPSVFTLRTSESGMGRRKPRVLEPSRSRSTSPTPSRKPIQAHSSTARKNTQRRGSFDLCLANSHQPLPANHSASLPSSPIHKVLAHTGKKSKPKVLASRNHIQSPLVSRRRRYRGYSSHGVDSSDEEVTFSGDDITTSENYRNLETFQKAQLTRKLRRARSKPEQEAERPDSLLTSPRSGKQHPARRRYFVMHNKAPMWNENSQVYQLDFGGRVTQESAKNFQIEFRGKQVMQFGRIDSNAYTLDFQYPFSAVQAFAVALANVTQRLK